MPPPLSNCKKIAFRSSRQSDIFSQTYGTFDPGLAGLKTLIETRDSMMGGGLVDAHTTVKRYHESESRTDCELLVLS
jgi:hypothetical protein